MDYFRGVVAVQDRSERVLELTEAVIKMNPAHYTVWCVSSPAHLSLSEE